MIRSLVFMFVCFFLLVGCAPKEDVVGQAGDIKITGAEYRRVMNRKTKLLGKSAMTVQEKQALVNVLIDRKILYREGVKLGMQPAEIELNAEEAKARGSLGDERAFEEVLKREGLDRDGFRREFAEKMVVKQVEEKLASGVAANEAEAKRYYDEHKGEYQMPPQYKIYLVQTKDEDDAARLLKQLKNAPAAFDRQALNQGAEELRNINSNAVLTPKSDFPDQMLPALASLKIGEVGGPVKEKKGCFIFRLLDRKEGYQKSWNEVRGEVSHLLFQENRKKAVDGWLAQQKSGLKIEIFTGSL